MMGPSYGRSIMKLRNMTMALACVGICSAFTLGGTSPATAITSEVPPAGESAPPNLTPEQMAEHPGAEWFAMIEVKCVAPRTSI